jgi:hypothetical protein
VEQAGFQTVTSGRIAHEHWCRRCKGTFSKILTEVYSAGSRRLPRSVPSGLMGMGLKTQEELRPGILNENQTES